MTVYKGVLVFTSGVRVKVHLTLKSTIVHIRVEYGKEVVELNYSPVISELLVKDLKKQILQMAVEVSKTSTKEKLLDTAVKMALSELTADTLDAFDR